MEIFKVEKTINGDNIKVSVSTLEIKTGYIVTLYALNSHLQQEEFYEESEEEVINYANKLLEIAEDFVKVFNDQKSLKFTMRKRILDREIIVHVQPKIILEPRYDSLGLAYSIVNINIKIKGILRNLETGKEKIIYETTEHVDIFFKHFNSTKVRNFIMDLAYEKLEHMINNIILHPVRPLPPVV